MLITSNNGRLLNKSGLTNPININKQWIITKK